MSWIKLPREALQIARECGPTAMAVFVHLVDLSDSEGRSWPLRATLAAALGVSIPTVTRAVCALREAGHIEVDFARKGCPNEYRLTNRVVSPVIRERITSDSTRITSDSTRITSDSGGRITSDSIKEQEKNNKKRKKRAPDVEIPESLRSERFAAIWGDWLEHRSELKKAKPLTAVAIRRALLKLEGWGEPRAVRALEHSLANGWSGIYEPDSNEPSGPPPPKNDPKLAAELERSRKIKQGRRNGNGAAKPIGATSWQLVQQRLNGG